MDLNLQIKPRSDEALMASYACPCGCQPRVAYTKGSAEIVDGCCCGNEFAVGPHASHKLDVGEGFFLQVDRFAAPWGESLEAAWKLGAAQQSAGTGHDHGDHGHDHGDHGHDHGERGGGNGGASTTALDPVCGMTVDIAGARDKNLFLEHEGTTYYFCGKGCKLEFGDDPAKYLDPSHVPSM